MAGHRRPETKQHAFFGDPLDDRSLPTLCHQEVPDGRQIVRKGYRERCRTCELRLLQPKRWPDRYREGSG